MKDTNKVGSNYLSTWLFLLYLSYSKSDLYVLGVLTLSETLVEFESVIKIKGLLANSYKIEKIEPPVFASDAEVNIVTVTLQSPDGKKETIRAYREESQAVREYIRNFVP